MTFRADGTSVVNVVDGATSGVALAFDPNMARQIAEALNKHHPDGGGRGRTDPLTGDPVEKIDVHDERLLSDVIGRGKFVKVVGPYATALMGTPDGRQIRSLQEGAVLPGDVTAGQARHLIDVGLAKVVEAKSADEVAEGAPTAEHREQAAGGQPPAVLELRDDAGEQPAGNAPREAWAEFAGKRGGPAEDTRPANEGGLTRDQLRDKYAYPA